LPLNFATLIDKLNAKVEEAGKFEIGLGDDLYEDNF